MALVKHVNRIFSKYRYNDEEFFKTISIGMTTNHNESMHHLLREMVPKKERAGLVAIKLGAALAVIRYNDGYQAVQNIFRSFSQSDPFICTKEAFRLLDNRRIMASKVPSPWQDTFAEEEMDEAKLSRQRAMHRQGYLHRQYSGAQPVIMDVTVSDDQEESHDNI